MATPTPVRHGSARKQDVLRELDATQRAQEATRKASAPKSVIYKMKAAKHRVFKFLDFDKGKLMQNFTHKLYT
jgi:hypothetical protein